LEDNAGRKLANDSTDKIVKVTKHRQEIETH